MADEHRRCLEHRFSNGRYAGLWKFRFDKPEYLKRMLGLFTQYIMLGCKLEDVAASLPPGVIVADIYGWKLDDLTSQFKAAWNGRWYIITPITQTPKGKIIRETIDGFWMNKGSKLIFFRGNKKKPIRTKWIMHEYYSLNDTKACYVVCEIYETKNDTKEKHAYGGMTEVCLVGNLRHKRDFKELQYHDGSTSKRRLYQHKAGIIGASEIHKEMDTGTGCAVESSNMTNDELFHVGQDLPEQENHFDYEIWMGTFAATTKIFEEKK